MRKSQVRLIVALITVLMVSTIATGCGSSKKAFIEEYSTLMDERLDEFFEFDEIRYLPVAPCEYEEEFGLQKIDYEVTSIKKENDTYIVEVVIDIKLDDSIALNETERNLLAHEIEWEFSYLESVTDGYLKETDCYWSYSSSENLDYMFVELITVNINGETVIGPGKRDRDNDDEVRCPVCGSSYSSTSDSASSIARTNMCSSCYKDYETTQVYMDAIDELPRE